MAQIIYFIDNIGYNKYVVEAGRDEPDVFFPKPLERKFLKTLFRLHFAWPINKHKDAPMVCLWYNRILKGIKVNASQEVYILFAESYHLAYCRGFIKWLKERYPISKTFFIFTNPVGLYNMSKVNTLRHLYDDLITFNYDDSVKHCLKYCNVMPYRLPSMMYSDLPKTDVFFIGSNKGRLRLLLDIYHKLTKQGLVCDFYICGVKAENMEEAPGITYNQYITYDNVLRHILASKCVLEVLQDSANYVSIRTMEALQYEKKLLTTNKNIVNESFYNSNIIKVIDSTENDADFINNYVEKAIYRRINLNTNFSEFKKYLSKL